jgi:ornithine decarboxylase
MESNERSNSSPSLIRDLPPTVTNLVDCARNEIQSLESLSAATAKQMNEEEEDALDDGFLVCDLAVVQRKLQVWNQMFPRVAPYFALKCNPDLQVAKELGCGSPNIKCGYDCASLMELKIAKQYVAMDTSGVVYANPQRAEQDLEQALQLGVTALTFDGPEELRKIQKSAAKLKLDPRELDLILRILVPDAHSSVPLGEKFGAPPNAIQPLAEEAKSLGLKVMGVSFHCGSGCHDPAAYVQALKLAREAMDIINGVMDEPCTLLDMGGGYPGWDGRGGDEGRFSGKAVLQATNGDNLTVQECTKDIAEAAVPVLDELFPASEIPHILSEPGRYFVEAAFGLASRITKARTDENNIRHYNIGHGVQGVFKDVILCEENFPPIPLSMSKTNFTENNNEGSTPTLLPSMVHGPGGDEYDIVCPDCQLPELQVGDWLVFDRMGAYTISIASRTGRPVIRYVRGGRSVASS